MLKRRITATEYRGMSTTAQSIYQQDGHGGYELDLENDDAETKRELDATRAELRETKKPLTWCKENLGGGNDPEVRLSSYRAAVDRAETSVLMTKAEFEAASAAFDAEYAPLLEAARHSPRVAKLQADLVDEHVRAVLAAEMYRAGVVAPVALEPHIRAAIRAELGDGDEVRITTIDKTGARVCI
jgi:hypothetical protein